MQFVFVVSFGRPLSCQVLLTQVHRTKDPELLDFLRIVRCRSQMGAVVLVFQNESAAAFDKHSWSVVSSRVQRYTLRGWWPERQWKGTNSHAFGFLQRSSRSDDAPCGFVVNHHSKVRWSYPSACSIWRCCPVPSRGARQPSRDELMEFFRGRIMPRSLDDAVRKGLEIEKSQVRPAVGGTNLAAMGQRAGRIFCIMSSTSLGLRQTTKQQLCCAAYGFTDRIMPVGWFNARRCCL